MLIRWFSAAALVLVVAGGGYWWWTRPAPAEYVTTPATLGTVTRAIISTGTVNPVITVEVGTYVSGPIESLFCDYNTRVTAGQVCARIDPRPYQVVVDQAKANLAIAKAQLAKDQASLDYAQLNYSRNLGLLRRGVVSQDTVDIQRSTLGQALAQVDLDRAAIQQYEAALEAAQINLDYTDIRSPVDGVVVSRDVNVGQTVAASFQTPTLFLIAQDLTKMQVDTNVSESDVGGARVGQRASFTVEAYPGRDFQGFVSQVRQAPITVQNVVTYDVVINVDNPDMRLLPGMTANVRIVSEERSNALRVPLAALRFEPAEIGTGGAHPPPASSASAHVWVFRDGAPVLVPVAVGIDDGVVVEIVSGNLKAGDAVIIDEVGSAAQRMGVAPARSPLRL